MASTKSVIVLAPNGRRQTIKVTPNTTILQVLEEVCKKHDLKPEEFDITHHNHVLDVSSIIRFSGLPNNAQLEMCAIQRQRAETVVVLGVQLENGTRLTGNYFPNDNLWNVLLQLCPDEIQPEKNPVIIYMRQEIIGMQALQNTTLKSLGLTSGRAMLRLIHRKPEELRTQANISAPLPHKPTEEKPYIRKLQRSESEVKETTNQSSQPKNIEPNRSPPTSPTTKKGNLFTEFIRQQKTKTPTDTSNAQSTSAKEDPRKNIQTATATSHDMEIEPEESEEEKIDFTFLGSRSALAFSLDMAETVPHDELPDEFFELTLKDARKLLRDLKQKRVEMEQSPLQTAALRNLEKDKKVLRHLNQYKKSVIRVQFPDRTVLQGSFKPLETINDVQQFVKEYLDNPSHEFHLYTTPPKSILNPGTSLLDAECVPSAVLHFSLNNSETKTNYSYLKKNLFNKFISHSLASIAAARSRGNEENRITSDNNTEDMDLDENAANTFDMSLPGPSSSKAGSSYPDVDPPQKSPNRSNEPKEKVPKWFRPNK